MKNIWKLLGGLGGLLLFIEQLYSLIQYQNTVNEVNEFNGYVNDVEVLYIGSQLFALLGYLLITIGFFSAKTSSN